MQVWEYRTVDVSLHLAGVHVTDSPEDLRHRALDEWLTALNELGAEGWEAIGEVHYDFRSATSGRSLTRLLLKRPAP